MGALTWRRPAHFGTPLTRFVAPRELHRGPQWVRPHGVAAPPISAHSSHVSWPPVSSTEGPTGCPHVSDTCSAPKKVDLGFQWVRCLIWGQVAYSGGPSDPQRHFQLTGNRFPILRQANP